MATQVAPPTYEAGPSGTTNISSRIAAMREQQAKRREQLMSQVNANRDGTQTQSAPRFDPLTWPLNNTAGSSTVPSAQQLSEEDKARKEASRQRIEHTRTKVLRAREEQLKSMLAKKKASSATSEADKVKKILEQVAQNAEAEKAADAEKKSEHIENKEDNIERSQMVFPKLDKESPASSTYQSAAASTSGSSKGKAAYVENEDGEIERSATPATAAPVAAAEIESPVLEKEEFTEFLTDDDFEDITVLSARGEDSESEDDGFMTDEEYDILDASDHETVKSE